MQTARSLAIGLAAVLIAAALFLHALSGYMRTVSTPPSPVVVMVPTVSPSAVTPSPSAVAAARPTPSPSPAVAPSPPPAVAPRLRAQPEPAEVMTLEGTIISTPGNSLAFIETRDGSHLTLHEGEQVEGFRVARIGDSEVEFAAAGHNHTLKMMVKEQSAPPPTVSAPEAAPTGGLLPPPPLPAPAASPLSVYEPAPPPPQPPVVYQPLPPDDYAPSAPQYYYYPPAPESDYDDYGAASVYVTRRGHGEPHHHPRGGGSNHFGHQFGGRRARG